MKTGSEIRAKKSDLRPTSNDGRMRRKIIDSAMNICLTDGLQALSMRRISMMIHATAPVIYQYFQNKKAIIAELSTLGFRRLVQTMIMAQSDLLSPEQELKKVWLAYWTFTQNYTSLYRLMLGVGAETAAISSHLSEIKPVLDLVGKIIGRLQVNCDLDEQTIHKNAYLLWAFVHGLTSLRLNHAALTENEYLSVLTDNIGLFCGIDKPTNTEYLQIAI